MQLKHKVFLTLDIDWAPDYMVDHVIDLCFEYQVKATFFATHSSSTLDRLKERPDFFELAVHPNFLPGSTQGKTEEEIFKYCKKLVPDARSLRTHCVYQHGRLYDQFNQHFGKRIVESSICMPGVNHIQPFELHTPSGCLIRVPFFWADDYYLLGKQKLDAISLLDNEGCKVYMFHPVHIYLNTESLEQYEEAKKLMNCERNKIAQRHRPGIGALFENFIKSVKAHPHKKETGLMQEFIL